MFCKLLLVLSLHCVYPVQSVLNLRRQSRETNNKSSFLNITGDETNFAVDNFDANILSGTPTNLTIETKHEDISAVGVPETNQPFPATEPVSSMGPSRKDLETTTPMLANEPSKIEITPSKRTEEEDADDEGPLIVTVVDPNDSLTVNYTESYGIFRKMGPIYGMVLVGQVIPFCESDMFCFPACGADTPTESILGVYMYNRTGTSKEFRTDHVGDYGKHQRCPEKDLLQQKCSCDSKCVLYGDCCPDVFAICFKLNTTEKIVDYINTTLKMSRVGVPSPSDNDQYTGYLEFSDKFTDSYIKQYSTCKTVSTGTSKPESMLLISRCPENISNDTLATNCETATSPLLPPVSASLESVGVSFKNVHCARCHGMQDENITVWSTQVQCDSSASTSLQEALTIPEVTELVVDGLCNVSFLRPSKLCSPRLCLPGAVLTQSQEDQLHESVDEGTCSVTDILLCKAYQSVLFGDRNSHCSKCLYRYPQTRKRRATHTVCEVQPSLPEKPEGGILLLLDLSGKFSRSNAGHRTYYLCAENEVFNPFTQDCRELLCAPGSIPYNGLCVQSQEGHFMDNKTQLYPNNWYRIKMSFIGSDRSFTCNIFFNMTEIINDQNFIFDSVEIYHLDRDNTRISANMSDKHFNTSKGHFHCAASAKKIEDVQNIAVADLKISLTFAIENSAGLNKLKEIVKTVVMGAELDDTGEITVTNMNVSELSTCPGDISPTSYTQFAYKEYRDTLYVEFSSSKAGVYYALQNIGYELKLAHNGSVLSEIVFVCEQSGIFFLDNCTVVAYDLNETFLNGSGLLINQSQEFYENEKFELRGDEVYVCSQLNFASKTISTRQSRAYLIVSLVFTSIAIVFLLSMVIIYIAFPELRTLPGKLTASLAVTMALTFFSNTFTLTELHNDYVCPVVAACSHFVTLAHFGWMSAIAVNMALTFGPGSMSRLKTTHDNYSFLRYNLAVWSISGVIVMTSVFLDLLHRDSFSSSDGHQANNSSEITPTTSSLVSSKPSSSSKSSIADEFPHYGYPFCTWFSGPLWTNLAFVIIPFGITYIVNVICFILTLVGIHQSSQKATKMGKKSSDRHRCVIYFKISTAMGFTWILSVLNNFVDEGQVLPYLFVVLVLGQGVLLFFSFMANKRVLSLIMKKGPKLYTSTGITSRTNVSLTNQL